MGFVQLGTFYGQSSMDLFAACQVFVIRKHPEVTASFVHLVVVFKNK